MMHLKRRTTTFSTTAAALVFKKRCGSGRKGDDETLNVFVDRSSSTSRQNISLSWRHFDWFVPAQVGGELHHHDRWVHLRCCTLRLLIECW